MRLPRQLSTFTFKSEAAAQDVLEWWKDYLGLGNWEIYVHIKRAADMPSGIMGKCHWVIQKHTAQILLLDPIDYPNDCVPFAHDHEITLVHELLHCHSAGFDNFGAEDAQDIALEQMIHHLSVVLVGLRRAAYSDIFEGMFNEDLDESNENPE